MGMVPVMLWGLMGCPYVFGGPDLSNVDAGTPPADTGATPQVTDTAGGVSESSPTATSPSGDTGIPGERPVVSQLTSEAKALGAALQLTLTDADGDLDGGIIRVSDGDIVTDYAIPEGLSAYDASTGVAVLAWEVADPCQGFDLSFEVTAIDVAGHVSAPTDVGVSLVALAHDDSVEPMTTGTLSPPVLVCGSNDSVRDEDRVRFTFAISGQHVLSLTWLDASDLALYLLNEAGQQIAQADQISLGGQPEEVSIVLDDLTPYEADVQHWEGPLTTEWRLFISGP